MPVKRLLKYALRIIVALIIVPVWLWYVALLMFLGKDRAFREAYEVLAYWPGTVGVLARSILCSWVFPHAGKDIYIGPGTLFSHADNIIGNNVYIGPNCSVGRVRIGNDVLVASHVSIINGGRQHGYEDVGRSIREQTGTWPVIHIGTGAWIGERAVVMADVGEHSIVGAGSVVTKAVPPCCIVAGNPARLIRTRKQQDTSVADTGNRRSTACPTSQNEVSHDRN